MSVIGQLIGERLTDPADSDVVFEGPFGGDKRIALGAAETAAYVAAVSDRLSEREFPGVPTRSVGVLSNHRVEAYLAVLAAASCGVTFVPLNPKFPVERLRTIVGLARPMMIVGDPTTRALHAEIARDIPFIDVSSVAPDARAIEHWAAGVHDAETPESSIAYTMFTSGSTGVPKGVPISYGNLIGYVGGITSVIDFPPRARWSQFFDLSFDLSMHDIFVSLAAGGTLVAPTQVDLMMPGAYVARERISVWFSVPLLGAQLGNAKPKDGFAGIDSMLFCGEALPVETVGACRSWLAPNGSIWNLYGPTEATIAFTAADVTSSTRSEGNASIGRAFGGNVTAMLLADGTVDTDPAIGEEGELLLGGPQVFEGYSTDSPSPFIDDESGRFYRSGDLVRIDGEGVYFRGRIDSQVKFRGYRIELGEIETVVRSAFGLKTVAVAVVGSGADAKLALFHLKDEVKSEGETAAALDVRLLESTLPKYMIPSEIIALDKMPTNQNGKIDRRQLVTDHVENR
jgi:D-alanine--poly(phosphoribitol) ligase subunit 1